MGGSTNLTPIVSKIFCSPSLTTLMVRKRPHVVNGGGFVVTDCSYKVVFMAEGCGILGKKGEIIVRDGNGASVLLLCKKNGICQAFSTHNRWNGYLKDGSGANDVIFSLSEPRPCLAMSSAIRIRIETKGHSKEWDFEVTGSFPSKSCTIFNRKGNSVAQVGMGLNGDKDLYQVMVQPGHDQAFVVGVIAVLDNIHGEATRC